MILIKEITSKEEYLWHILKLAQSEFPHPLFNQLLGAVETAYDNDIDPEFALFESNNFAQIMDFLMLSMSNYYSDFNEYLEHQENQEKSH